MKRVCTFTNRLYTSICCTVLLIMYCKLLNHLSVVYPSDYLFSTTIHLQQWMPLWRGKTQEGVKKTVGCIPAQIAKLKQESTLREDPSGVG